MVSRSITTCVLFQPPTTATEHQAGQLALGQCGGYRLKRSLLLLVLVTITALLQGCSAGEVSYDEQKAKKDALQKVADDHKSEDPNHEDRGR